MSVTYDEAVKVDRAMADHMYSHTISNSYGRFACDADCRIQALQMAIIRMLEERD